ncbi:MAG: hypothetical protein ABI237_02715 [Ginsengibacter sp.]
MYLSGSFIRLRQARLLIIVGAVDVMIKKDSKPVLAGDHGVEDPSSKK